MSTEAVLNQDEVDALLQGMNAGQVSTDPAPPPGTVRPFDLGKDARIVRGRMAALELMNERFARLYRSSLYDLLRRPVGVAVGSVQTLKFSDYLQRLHVPSSLNLVRLAPLSGTAMMVLTPQLVFSVVDHFFGGKGRVAKISGREFTATEGRIAQRMLEAAFKDLREAWAGTLPITIEHVSTETDPQFTAIASPNEVMVVLAFPVELDNAGAELQLALPYSMLEPFREVLDGGASTADGATNGRWSQSLREEIEDAEVELTTLVGRAQVTLADLLNFKPGDVIPCDFNGKATVYAEHVPILRGGFGLSRGQKAVKVEERVLRNRARPAATNTTSETRRFQR